MNCTLMFYSKGKRELNPAVYLNYKSNMIQYENKKLSTNLLTVVNCNIQCIQELYRATNSCTKQKKYFNTFKIQISFKITHEKRFESEFTSQLVKPQEATLQLLNIQSDISFFASQFKLSFLQRSLFIFLTCLKPSSHEN